MGLFEERKYLRIKITKDGKDSQDIDEKIKSNQNTKWNVMAQRYNLAKQIYTTP